MRRITIALSAACALASLGPVVPASGTPAPDARPATAAAPVAPATVTPATFAPAVPGAHRFDGTIPFRVRQVLVVSATSWRSTTGKVSLYTRTATGWRRVVTWPARLGYGGLVVGTRRVQSTGTTPAGSYAITTSFGRKANPGAHLPFTRVGSDHWWVEDRRSAYYNQMRLGRLGGFARTTHGYNGSEHLSTMGAQYDYVAVIDFNRPRPVIGRGAGIFLHSFGSGLTAGCVAIRHDHMLNTLRWLSPPAYPRILIGEDDWLAA